MQNDGIVKISKDIILKNMLKKIAILNKTLILKAKIAFRENIACNSVYASLELKCNSWGNILGYFTTL